MSSLQPRVSRAVVFWTAAGLVLLGANLRASLTGVSPILEEIRRQFGLSGTSVGLLTTLPVICLGVFALLTPRLAGRLGAEATTAGAMLLMAAGLGLRLVPSAPALFAGTALVGMGIAIGNVIVPYVVKSVFPHRIGLYTGLVMMLIACGAALATGFAVPLAEAGTWRLALGIWVVPALLAAAIWIPLAVRRRGAAERPAASRADSGGSLARDPLVWSITGFMGLQSLLFYSIMTWLPAIMRDNGHSPATAGSMLAVVLLLGIPTGLLVPMLAVRLRDQRPLTVLICALMAAGIGGLVLAPQAGWLWAAVLGTATGSALPLALTLVALRSAAPMVAARLAGLVQGVGYLLAALGPFSFGALHDATGGWRVPLLVTLLVLVPQSLCAWYAGRPGRVVGSRPVPVVEPKQPVLVPVLVERPAVSPR